ncbi:MAG: hypothetical protein V1845_02020 [bacterium]
MAKNLVWVTEVYKNLCDPGDNWQHYVWEEATEEEAEKFRKEHPNSPDLVRRFQKKRIAVKEGQKFSVIESDCFSPQFSMITIKGKRMLKIEANRWDGGKIILSKKEVKKLSTIAKRRMKAIELEDDLYPGTCETNTLMDVKDKWGKKISLTFVEIFELQKRIDYLGKRTTFEF